MSSFGGQFNRKGVQGEIPLVTYLFLASYLELKGSKHGGYDTSNNLGLFVGEGSFPFIQAPGMPFSEVIVTADIWNISGQNDDHHWRFAIDDYGNGAWQAGFSKVVFDNITQDTQKVLYTSDADYGPVNDNNDADWGWIATLDEIETFFVAADEFTVKVYE